MMSFCFLTAVVSVDSSGRRRPIFADIRYIDVKCVNIDLIVDIRCRVILLYKSRYGSKHRRPIECVLLDLKLFFLLPYFLTGKHHRRIVFRATVKFMGPNGVMANGVVIVDVGLTQRYLTTVRLGLGA